MSLPDVSFEPVHFADLDGWQTDAHDTTFKAFQASSERLLRLAAKGSGYLGQATSPELLVVAERSMSEANKLASANCARKFFEQYFEPYRVVNASGSGLLTGYYEPNLKASRTKGEGYDVPILRRPPQLINLVSEADRGQFGDQHTHAFETPTGSVTCPTRRQIENGALDDQDLVLAWLRCPVEAFFLHVEGSGILEFDDGSSTRVTYDGKNGHPYTSVGARLIEQGVFQRGALTFQALKAWLLADLDRARAVLWENESYIFFRALSNDEPKCALGVMQIPLVPLRSLAVDTTYHEIGTPIFVSAPKLTHVSTNGKSFSQLMIAHDVGSAIRGSERGDIFFGSGKEAGDHAGQTVHEGSFCVLKPKAGLA